MRHILASLLLCFAAFAATAEEAVPRTERVAVETATGVTEFVAEIADTDPLRQRGLMFRRSLAPDRAMLFDFGQPRPVSMWMKNTYIALDMVFIRADGTVAGVASNTKPHSLDAIGVDDPVLGVLEVAAGTAARIGLKPGDKVRHPMFERIRQ